MKGILFKSIFIGCLAYFAPIKAIIHLILIISAIDFILGAGNAVRVGGIKAFKSRKARRSVVKIGAYLIAVMIGFAIELTLFNVSAGYLTKSIASAIILVEFSSILENLALATGKEVFRKIFELTKTIFNTKKDLLTKIDSTLEMDEDNEVSK